MIKNRVCSYPARFSILAFGYRKHKRPAAIGISGSTIRTIPVMKASRTIKRLGMASILFLSLFAESIPVSANGLPVAEAPATASASTKQTTQHNDKGHPAMNEAITIRIGPSSYSATLSDNPTAQAFRKLLPSRRPSGLRKTSE